MMQQQPETRVRIDEVKLHEVLNAMKHLQEVPELNIPDLANLSAARFVCSYPLGIGHLSLLNKDTPPFFSFTVLTL